MACAAPPQNTRKAEPRQTIEDEDAYAHKVLQEILDGRLDLHGNPWVAPKNPFQEAVEINGKRKESGEPAIDSTEALNLVLRTPMFVWAPEKLAPGLIVRCPNLRHHEFWHSVGTSACLAQSNRPIDLCIL